MCVVWLFFSLQIVELLPLAQNFSNENLTLESENALEPMN